MDSDLSDMLLAQCGPNSEAARLCVLVGAIENASVRILAAQRDRLHLRVAEMALEELNKIFAATDLYRKARGF